jgi:hypothetical protein
MFDGGLESPPISEVFALSNAWGLAVGLEKNCAECAKFCMAALTLNKNIVWKTQDHFVLFYSMQVGSHFSVW